RSGERRKGQRSRITEITITCEPTAQPAQRESKRKGGSQGVQVPDRRITTAAEETQKEANAHNESGKSDVRPSEGGDASEWMPGVREAGPIQVIADQDGHTQNHQQDEVPTGFPTSMPFQYAKEHNEACDQPQAVEKARTLEYGADRVAHG